MDRRPNAAWVSPQAVKNPHGRPAHPERHGEIEAPDPDGRPTDAETRPAAAPSGVSWLGALFRPDPPPALNLPREPAATPEAAPPSKPRQLPPSEPETVSGDKPEETPARPASPGDKPEDDPPRPAAPAGAPAERSPRETPPSPATATPPGPTRDPDARTSPPPSSTAPSPVPEIDWERRLKGLPKVLIPRVKALSQRPGRDILQPLIFDICRLRKWTTAGELARWLSMHQGMLVHRHLRPMLEAGVLKLKFPDRPKSRHQAYRARRREAPQAN